MPHLIHARPTRRAGLALAAGLLLVGTMPLAAGAAPQNGFKTLEPAMLSLGSDSPLGMTIKPILTVGDMIGSYRFEAIPDGISIMEAGKNSARVFVNHETSTVPFRFNASPTAANSENDFDNSMLSDLVIHKGGAVQSAELIIESDAGFNRFCSNFLARDIDGFDRPILFNNEEGIDWVWENGDYWTGNLENVAGARQIGVVVAYDIENETYETIWGMGRLNHENNVSVPGYDKPVLLSGDDAFVNNPAQSQVYAYIADDADAVMADDGDLWAFVSDSPTTVNDYFDFGINGATGVDEISGHFIKVPKEIATGRNLDDTDMISSEVPEVFSDGTLRGLPYDPPPPNSSWQRPPGTGGATVGIDGPQWILETWSDRNNVFEFIRIEDIATDKRPDMQNVVYLADSGRGTGGAAGAGISTNGRIWKMVFDTEDPTVVESLTILIEGDDAPVKSLGEIHQPDNLETSLNGLYITEDPGSSQQFALADQGLANATTARLWQYKFAGPALGVVAKVDQSADEGPTDEDGALSSAGNWGSWETTGILDVSAYFGPGKFLINVQAHTLWIDIASGPTNIDADADVDWTWKREGGQLLLITIPGG